MKKNFKNMGKAAGILALSFAIISPSVSFASEAEAQRLLNKLYNQMDEISELTGMEKIDRPAKESSSKGSKTTKTTTSSSETTVINKDSKKEEEKAEQKEPAYLIELRDSYNRNDISVKALEEILQKYPNTIKGKEEKLVNLLVEAHELKLQAADLINTISNNKVKVDAPNIPVRYRHLVNS